MSAFVAEAHGEYNAVSFNATLPGGISAGQTALVLMVNSNNDSFTTTGLTAIVPAQLMGTGSIYIGKKVLNSTDISNGYLALGRGNGFVNVMIAVFSGVSDFGTPGTVNKRASSSTSITAPAVTLSSGQKALVVRLDKAPSNPGPSSVSPATTRDGYYFPNNSGRGSIWVGEYTGTAADRTFTDTVASGNGAGVQIPVIESAPASPTVSLWDGATEITGCTFSVWDGATEVAVTIETT